MNRSDAKKHNKFVNRTLTPMQVIGEAIGIVLMVSLFAAAIYVF